VHKGAVHHTRLWLGTAAGVAIFFLAPGEWSFLPRVLTAWDGGVLLFLALVYGWMIGLDAKLIHARYQDGDPTAPVILLVVTIAAVASLVAIVALLGTVKHVATTERLMHIGLATVTIVESWILVATMFTLHYANMFYRSLDQPPLRFPETADVCTTNVSIRRVVTFQTLISFLFNVSILGFALNVSAGLLGG